MTDSPITARVLDALQVLATITAIGVGAGVLIPLVGEFIVFTYLMPEGME
jgi:hypothetical protein